MNKGKIEESARRLLATEPEVIVRFRLLRDCLRLADDSPKLVELKSRLLDQRWIKELSEQQHPDGSWGRFHTQDTKIKTVFPTSETAIRRALALGLDKDSTILKRAIRYMQGVLEGSIKWSDRVERSEGWPTGVEAISAGTLAQVDPTQPTMDGAWEYWTAVAQRSFKAGRYDERSEIQAHREIRGLKIVYLKSRYVLTLLGSRSGRLPAETDRQIVDWIWNSEDGIGYLGAKLGQPDQYHINQWLESQEILSGYQSWRDLAEPSMQWLWNQRDEDGLWDLGKQPSGGYFPLSDTWRKPGKRRTDHSTRVLALLRRFLE